MKNLFVIHKIDNIKKDEKKEIFQCMSPKESEKIYPTLKLSETQLNATNNLPTTTSNSSSDSRKYSLNMLSPEPSSFNLNISSNSNTNLNDTNQFLGKKIKFNFDIIKDNLGNIEKDEINQKDNIINEKTEKNNFFKLDSLESKKKTKRHKETNSFLNEGRWSTEEHIRFIEGLVEYGKNWKNVQKCVGTRSTAQARSHAQKFLLKLKMVNCPHLNIDLTNNQIKSLSGVIEEIKRKNKNNEKEKKFIIDYLKILSDIITNENKEIYKKRNKNTKLKFDSKKSKEIINSNKIDLNENNIDNFSKNINLNEENSKEINIENYEGKKSQNKSIDIDNIKNNDYFENENKEAENKLEIEKSINLIENEEDYQLNKKLIFDDGIAFYSDNTDYFYWNNIRLRIKDYFYNRNFESLSIINTNFFS